MFTIIGGDGKEYGPVTTDQVRAWIAGGRANLDTKAKAIGSDEWRRLGDYAEFSGNASIPPAMSAPDLPPGSSAPTFPSASTSTFSPATTPAAATPYATAETAERGTRLIARLIDWVVSIGSTVPGALLMGSEFINLVTVAMRGEQIDMDTIDAPKLALGAGVLFGGWLLGLIIQVTLIAMRSQSIGKIIMRLRVVKLDGTPAGIVHGWLLREALITVIGFVLGFMPGIGPIMLRPAFHITDWCFIFRADQRCLHDLIAGTRVVKA